MPLLIAFSGQGLQHKDMFRLLKSDDFGKAWLLRASQILDKDLLNESCIQAYCSDVIYCQLLIVLLSVGAFRLLNQALTLQPLLCGYSLGEISAFCVSANLSVEEICVLVKTRGELMQQALASDSKQAAGLGVLKGNIDLQLAKKLVDKYQCYIAIINADDHYIIGGLFKQIDAVLQDATYRGVKTAHRLAVYLPSHTPLLKTASMNFAHFLQKFTTRVMQYPILNALTTDIIFTTEKMLAILAKELAHPLQWGQLMQIAVEYEVSAILELGPGIALKKMFMQATSVKKIYAWEDFSTIKGAIRFVEAC